jgi:hypothetical protein
MHGCNFQIVQYSPIITGVAQAAVLQEMLNYYNLTEKRNYTVTI